MALVTLTISPWSPNFNHFKVLSMMYTCMCHFGQKLAICSEDRVQTRFFIDLYDPIELENQVKVTQIYSFLKILQINVSVPV